MEQKPDLKVVTLTQDMVDSKTSPQELSEDKSLNLKLEMIPKLFEGFLGKEDEYNSFIEKSDLVIKEYVPGMTKYQVVYGVLSDKDHPTPDSKYQQCILELITRRSQIMNLCDDIKDLSDDVEELGFNLDELVDELEQIDKLKIEEAGESAVNVFELGRKRVRVRRTVTSISRKQRKMNNLFVEIYRLVRESNIFIIEKENLLPKLSCPPEEYVDNMVLEQFKNKMKIDMIRKEYIQENTDNIIIQQTAIDGAKKILQPPKI